MLGTAQNGLLAEAEDSRAEEADDAEQNSHFVPVAGATASAGSSTANGDSLLAFLWSQHHCIRGSVDEYYAWLVKSEQIDSIATLKEAMSDDQYLHDIMTVGCGSSGLMGFRRLAFQRAVGEYREGFKRAETPPPTKRKGSSPPRGIAMNDDPPPPSNDYSTKTPPPFERTCGIALPPSGGRPNRDDDDNDGIYDESTKLQESESDGEGAEDLSLADDDDDGGIFDESTKLQELESDGEGAEDLSLATQPDDVRVQVREVDVHTEQERLADGAKQLPSKNPPPGPGWTLKRVTEAGHSRSHWLSPIRRIEFKRNKQACEFEWAKEVEGEREDRRHPPPPQTAMSMGGGTGGRATVGASSLSSRTTRTNSRPVYDDATGEEEDDDDAKFAAWNEYRKDVCGQTIVVSPRQYDLHDSLPRETPPSRQVRGTERMTGPNSTISIEKTAHAKGRPKTTLIGACSSKLAQKMTRVTKASSPPGPGWESKLVECSGQNRLHWCSPIRRIEFKRYQSACQFEDLKKNNENDEVSAWNEYRSIGGQTYVVSPRQYDLHDSLPRETPPSRQARGIERMTGPNSTIPIAIDQIWASSLVGLRLKVPERWWNGYTRNTLYAGQITAVNFSDRAKPPFMFKLDSEENGDHYRMNYDAVLFYADKEHPTYAKFDLPEKPPADLSVTRSGKRKGREEHSQAVKAQKLQKTSHLAAKKLPNASINSKNINCSDQAVSMSKALQKTSLVEAKSKRKNSPVIKSTKKCRITSAPTYVLDCPFQSFPQPTFPHDGLNSSDIMTICLKQTMKKTFFSELFKGQVHRVQKSLNDVPPEKSVSYGGKKYYLVSAKMLDNNCGSMQFFQEKKIELMYINKKGLQQELEKLGCFGSLKPEKVVARLAHLQAEAQKIVYIEASKIEIIEEEGHEEGFFDWANAKKSCDAIQVRILSPTIGFAKGMLLKKRGINCIQLPSSMIKVPPSETCTDSWAAVVIKNVFPSEENKQMGRFLDPDAAKANKSWMDNDRRKPLSTMYQRMLIGYGVKESDIKAYTRAAKKPKYLKHAHLKGCIDPTGAIPQKKVFISGYTIDGDKNRALFGKVHTKVYLSRSPCLEPTDAKLVSVIGSKPEEMSKDDWDMLCSYGFGTIIFPRSNEGSTPLPCVIADGDLDGDDYFVMWDEKIIHHLIYSVDKLTSKARRELFKLELPTEGKSVDKETKFAKSSDSKWLSKAQDKMLDFPRQRAATQLVGKLYGLCTDSSKKPRGLIDLFDKNAIAYAQAYKDALYLRKPGGTIYLPGHLHENLSKSHQQLLTSKVKKTSI